MPATLKSNRHLIESQWIVAREWDGLASPYLPVMMRVKVFSPTSSSVRRASPCDYHESVFSTYACVSSRNCIGSPQHVQRGTIEPIDYLRRHNFHIFFPFSLFPATFNLILVQLNLNST